MTILLTSHYMKDVVALCRRVVIIAQGRIIYDGSLGGIFDRFGGQKVISLLVADGQMPDDLGRYGEVLADRAAAGEAADRAEQGDRGPLLHPLAARDRRRQRRRPAAGRDDCESVQGESRGGE